MVKIFAHSLTQHRIKLLLFLGVPITAFLCTLYPVSAQPTLSEQSKVTIDGIGPVRIGMTLQEAVNASIPLTLKTGAGVGNRCGFANPLSGPKGLEFMVTDGRIARVDILRNQKITLVQDKKLEKIARKRFHEI